MVSMEEFAAELSAFNNSRAVVNEIRREMRKPLPQLRKDIRRIAIAKLPASGGLGAWVAQSRVTIQFKDRGRSAGLRVKVSRKSGRGKAALDDLDKSGRIRHPLYGNRRHWYGQAAASGFFTEAWDQAKWIELADKAFDKALDKIRRG
jgi:hypothetical protein